MRSQSLAAAVYEARIMIVDDQPANVRLLEKILAQSGFHNVSSTIDPRQVLPLYMAGQPDILVLDLHMPHLDGFAVMEQLRPRMSDGEYVPILVLTADVTPQAKERALSLGARDFLTKPFDHVEVLLRVKNLLETRLLHVQQRNQNRILELKVKERTEDLEEAQLETIERLAIAAEFRDDDTGEHTQRVGLTAGLIAAAMDLDPGEIDLIRTAAPLHDVGKIGIPDSILLKPEKLTDDEFEIMKSHTTLGARILSGSRYPVLQAAEEIALTHHERWDGNGYAGLRGPSIPLRGRIVAVADVFDALTHERPYKDAWPPEKAIDEIRKQSGAQFDPDVVRAFNLAQGRTDLVSPPEEDLSLT